MATNGAQKIKKQEALVSFSIISYKTRLRVYQKPFHSIFQFQVGHSNPSNTLGTDQKWSLTCLLARIRLLQMDANLSNNN